MIVAFFVILFAIFPLTDTDIWWHLACAREWVTTWTPVRMPIVNVHEYFQLAVGFVYGLGGAPLLVAFKAVLWGVVFALFVGPQKIKFNAQSLLKLSFVILVLLLLRHLFEVRPVLFSLLFLGVYWNILPWLAQKCRESGSSVKLVACVALILAIQWLWCKCQGLYILGPIFATLVLSANLFESKKQGALCKKSVVFQVAFVLILWSMPFLHREGLALFLYPFGLLDRLLGLTPSATAFASQIAENRSPITLLMAGENCIASVTMIVLSLAGAGTACWRLYKNRRPDALNVTVVMAAILALVAERNFVLFLPVLFGSFYSKCILGFHSSLLSVKNDCSKKTLLITNHCLLSTVYFLLPTFFIFGLWARSLFAYDMSMVAYQRVPVDATAWMQKHPHSGKLFNDDRAGGYLALMNPTESIYIDGRFILKTADFFERYLNYAKDAALFMHDADSLGIDRALFPLQYYARWDELMSALDRDSRWQLVYRDEYFAIFDKIIK